MEEFDDEESFTRSRLKSLSVNLNVERDTFKMDYRAGYNRSKTTSSPSFLLEQRLFELKLGNYREYLDRGMTFTEDFKEDVAMLPPTYEESDPTCVRKFQRFFNRFGYYMVTSAYGGGSVEVKCGRDTVGSENTSLEQMKVSLDAVLGGLDVAKGNVSAGSRIVDGQKTKALLEQSSFSWQGGDAALQTKETIGDKKKLQKWKDSLIQNPVMLTSELTLDPISNVVGCIDDAKGDATDVALRDILNSNNIRQKRKVPPKTPLTQDANTREGTVRDPKPSAICFPSGSVVQVQSKDGEVKQKKMANLDVGDKVMAWDEKRNKAVFSKVMMFAHLAPDAMAVEYLKITLEDGNKITLSDNHLVMVGKQKKAVLARKVKPGDILFSVDENREISPKKVLAVEKVVEQGIYCPITVHGNVIVDNVLASCYASVEDHVLLKGVVKISAQSMAHLGLMPMRALHKLRSKWLREIPNGQTIHPYLQWLCKLNLPWMAN
jgi:DNA-binding transcriptional regulator YdaS (Cro superfamily)